MATPNSWFEVRVYSGSIRLLTAKFNFIKDAVDYAKGIDMSKDDKGRYHAVSILETIDGGTYYRSYSHLLKA